MRNSSLCALQVSINFIRDRRSCLFEPFMLGSHCRFLSIDSEVHRQNEEFWHVATKEPRVNKVDNSLVDEVEHVPPLVC